MGYVPQKVLKYWDKPLQQFFFISVPAPHLSELGINRNGVKKDMIHAFVIVQLYDLLLSWQINGSVLYGYSYQD